MKIFASIRNCFQQVKIVNYSGHYLSKFDKSRRNSHNSQNDNMKKPAGSEPGFEFLDGMSTVTARFIIDREVNPDLFKLTIDFCITR